MENLLTKEDVAQRIQCHPRSVKRYCDRNGIAYLRTSFGLRFIESEMDKHLESLKVVPKKETSALFEEIKNVVRKDNLARILPHPSVSR